MPEMSSEAFCYLTGSGGPDHLTAARRTPWFYRLDP